MTHNTYILDWWYRLEPDEQQYLLQSTVCTVCKHLDVLHNARRACLVPQCTCDWTPTMHKTAYNGY